MLTLEEAPPLGEFIQFVNTSLLAFTCHSISPHAWDLHTILVHAPYNCVTRLAYCFECVFNYWEPFVGILGTISGEFRLTLDRFLALFRDWRHQLGTILDKFDHFGCLVPLHGCMGAHFGQNSPKVDVPMWPKRRPKMTKNQILFTWVVQCVFRRLLEPVLAWF